MAMYEDGDETKSDFLARMILMGRIDVDEKNQTLKSNITCKEEDPSACLPTAPQPIANPFNVSQEDTNCMKFNVSAKGFFSSYTEKVDEGVLEGARSLIFEASKGCDIDLKADGASVKNEANFVIDEWHHKYNVSFTVIANSDPKPFLAKYFEENIKQLGDAAVRIAYVETAKLEK